MMSSGRTAGRVQPLIEADRLDETIEMKPGQHIGRIFADGEGSLMPQMINAREIVSRLDSINSP